MKRGAADYLGKPFDLARVERIVRDLAIGPRARRRRAGPEREARADARRAASASATCALPETLIGRSPAMVEVFKEIGRVARTEMTVLLMGESGHRQGARGPRRPLQLGPRPAAPSSP